MLPAIKNFQLSNFWKDNFKVNLWITLFKKLASIGKVFKDIKESTTIYLSNII